MNLLLLTAEDILDDKTARVSGYRAEHLCTIHKAQVGDSVRVGVIEGKLGSAEILAIDGKNVDLRFVCDEPPPPAIPLTLVLALPRPQMLKRSLQTIAAMGIKQVYLLATARVEKSYWSSPSLSPEQIEEHLLLGLEQGIDTHMPTIHLRKRFKPFVEDELPQLCRNKTGWVAHPGNYPPCPRIAGGENVLVIGPEGGLLDYEVDLLVAAGCQAIQLGPRILRVETALPVLVSRFYPY